MRQRLAETAIMGLMLIVGLIALIADSPPPPLESWIIDASLTSPKSNDTVGDEFTMQGTITAHRDGHDGPAADLLDNLQISVDPSPGEVYAKYTAISDMQNIHDDGNTVTADWSVQFNADALGYAEYSAGTEIKLEWGLFSSVVDISGAGSTETRRELTLVYQPSEE